MHENSVVLDYDSDGDPDFLIGALGEGADRLHINHLLDDGTFHLDATDGVITGLNDTAGTLGMALADFNADGKLDVVQAQGELADDERIWVGDDIKKDTAAPEVLSIVVRKGSLIARIHDNKSPSRNHDWKSVVLNWQDGDRQGSETLKWVGEFYWRVDIESENLVGEVCATDIAGNKTCSAFGDVPTSVGKGDEVDNSDEVSAGDGCETSSPQGFAFIALLLFGFLFRRKPLQVRE